MNQSIRSTAALYKLTIFEEEKISVFLFFLSVNTSGKAASYKEKWKFSHTTLGPHSLIFLCSDYYGNQVNNSIEQLWKPSHVTHNIGC